MSAVDPAIRLEHVRVTFGGRDILVDATADIPRAELTAVIGPNGAGKTTLLRAVLGRTPFDGRIVLAPVNGRPPRIGYVPQQLDFDRGAPITVADFLCAELQRRPLWLGQSAAARDRAAGALHRVGVGRQLDQPLGKLSGGELQRVLLAMALLPAPDILLMDEPVAGVDVAGQEMFCDLLADIQEQMRCTMVLVSHDLSLVTQHADYVVCLNQRVFCHGRAMDTLTADNLEAIYGPKRVLYHHHDRHEGAGHSHPACGHDHDVHERDRDVHAMKPTVGHPSASARRPDTKPASGSTHD